MKIVHDKEDNLVTVFSKNCCVEFTPLQWDSRTVSWLESLSEDEQEMEIREMWRFLMAEYKNYLFQQPSVGATILSAFIAKYGCTPSLRVQRETKIPRERLRRIFKSKAHNLKVDDIELMASKLGMQLYVRSV